MKKLLFLLALTPMLLLSQGIQLDIFTWVNVEFEFDQYLGFLAFLTILTIGFWLFFVLLLFVIPYWVFGAIKERIEEIIEERKK